MLGGLPATTDRHEPFHLAVICNLRCRRPKVKAGGVLAQRLSCRRGAAAPVAPRTPRTANCRVPRRRPIRRERPPGVRANGSTQLRVTPWRLPVAQRRCFARNAQTPLGFAIQHCDVRALARQRLDHTRTSFVSDRSPGICLSDMRRCGQPSRSSRRSSGRCSKRPSASPQSRADRDPKARSLTRITL
jgi:hypothetical protein